MVNNLIQSGTGGDVTHLAGFRVDHAIGDRQGFFIRYSKNREDITTPVWLNNAAQGFTGQNEGVNAIAGDYTLVMSPTTILDVRYGFTGRFNLALGDNTAGNNFLHRTIHGRLPLRVKRGTYTLESYCSL